MARVQQMPIDVQRHYTGVEAKTFDYGGSFRAEIDLTGMTLPAIAGGANLAVGRHIYTYPAGAIAQAHARITVALHQTQGNVTADTPDLGLGTTIASGVVAVLSGTAAFENIMTGQTMNDCNGTVEELALSTALLISAAGDHNVYLNVADGWAASGDAGIIVRGKIVLIYSVL